MRYQQYFSGKTTLCTLDGKRRSLDEIFALKEKSENPVEVLAEDTDGNIVVVGLVGISKLSTSEVSKCICKNIDYFRVHFKRDTYIDLLPTNRLYLKNSKNPIPPDQLKTNKLISALYQQYRHSNGAYQSPDYISLINCTVSKFIDRPKVMPRHMFSYAFYSKSKIFQHYRKTNQVRVPHGQQRQIHHIDYDSKNDSESNLRILYKTKHNSLHHRNKTDRPSQKITKLLHTFMILGLIPTQGLWELAIYFIKKFGWESVSDFPNWVEFENLAKDRVRLLHALRKLLKKYYTDLDPASAPDGTYFYPLDLGDFRLKRTESDTTGIIKSLSLLNTIFGYNRHISYKYLKLIFNSMVEYLNQDSLLNWNYLDFDEAVKLLKIKKKKDDSLIPLLIYKVQKEYLSEGRYYNPYSVYDIPLVYRYRLIKKRLCKSASFRSIPYLDGTTKHSISKVVPCTGRVGMCVFLVEFCARSVDCDGEVSLPVRGVFVEDGTLNGVLVSVDPVDS